MSGSNKPAMKRIGYFGEAGYTTIGDPFKTKVKESMPRYQGAQFQTNPKFVSDTRFKLTNGLFSKAPALYNVRPPRAPPARSGSPSASVHAAGCPTPPRVAPARAAPASRVPFTPQTHPSGPRDASVLCRVSRTLPCSNSS